MKGKNYYEIYREKKIWLYKIAKAKGTTGPN
jgi:hypothetical protein